MQPRAHPMTLGDDFWLEQPVSTARTASKPTEKPFFIREYSPVRWANLASISHSERGQILPGAALRKSVRNNSQQFTPGLVRWSRTLPQPVRQWRSRAVLLKCRYNVQVTSEPRNETRGWLGRCGLGLSRCSTSRPSNALAESCQFIGIEVRDRDQRFVPRPPRPIVKSPDRSFGLQR